MWTEGEERGNEEDGAGVEAANVNVWQWLWRWWNRRGTEPQQVHIAYSGDGGMVLSWVTLRDVASHVRYGTTPAARSLSVRGSSNRYQHKGTLSPVCHHALLPNLAPSTTYHYAVGDPQAGLSREYSFTTGPALGAESRVVFGVVADIGSTQYSKCVLRCLALDPSIHAVLAPGDLAYSEGDQSQWDKFGEAIEEVASSKPFMVGAGNHEREANVKWVDKAFRPYLSRFVMPAKASGAPEGSVYYSFEVGSAHVIFLTSYVAYQPATRQYKWLLHDLQKVNRSRTPWLFVCNHNPWYSSFPKHESERADMQPYLEKLFVRFGVDAVFGGHIHAYERSHRVYKGELTNNAPMYFVVGTGGSPEGLSHRNASAPVQPWTAFYDVAFGYLRVETTNSTHALLTWHRLEGDTVRVADQVWLTHYPPVLTTNDPG